MVTDALQCALETEPPETRRWQPRIGSTQTEHRPGKCPHAGEPELRYRAAEQGRARV